MKNQKIFLTLTIVLLGGCATLSSMTTMVRLAYEGEPQPLDKVAVIIGDGRISFHSIDGAPPKHYRKLVGNALAAVGGALEIDVLPGTHYFELCYNYKETVGVTSTGQPINNTYQCESTLRASLDAEAGKIYQFFHVDAGRQRWKVEIKDVTEKYQVRVQKAREKIIKNANARAARRAQPDSQ